MYGIFKLSQLGFVGAGKIVEVLTKGFVASGVIQNNKVWASAPTDAEVQWIRHLGCNVSLKNTDILDQNKVVILAVKPQILPKVLKEIAPAVTEEHLLLSVAAGITIANIENVLPKKSRVARIMTNTPVMFRNGVSAFSMGTNTKHEDHEILYKLMSSVGYCVEVKEDLMDTVTGFAGGGPAYLYTVIEALADGAVRGGLNRVDAVKMAAQMTIGAARMVQETGLHTSELKDAVCSPGGTTIVGVNALEQGGLRATLMNAVNEATLRAKELGTSLNGQSSKM
eukprot:Seg147.7 transcript_id=Seg147.7/GoldUCD/mRNA.D3Y31 product="Pyrroline-5-carboxylate reductase 1 mitochondrial" protein_id=Seg147.7/GoldUCD/D3Y31